MSIEDMKENVAFYEASKEGLKDDMARTTAESTQIGMLFDSARM